ncbi:MAG: hypothetical protein ACI35O_04025 [Bacillaceae bacterium]
MTIVYVTHVMINNQLEFAGVFANKEDVYGYLNSNGLAGTVNHTEVVGVSIKEG